MYYEITLCVRGREREKEKEGKEAQREMSQEGTREREKDKKDRGKGERWRGKRGRTLSNAQWRLDLSIDLYKNFFSILQVTS